MNKQRGKPTGKRDSVLIKLQDLYEMFEPETIVRVNRKWLEGEKEVCFSSKNVPKTETGQVDDKIEFEVTDDAEQITD